MSIIAPTLRGKYPGPGVPSTESSGNPNAGIIKNNVTTTIKLINIIPALLTLLPRH